MPATKELVITQAMELSESDRLDVIDRLSESLSSAAAVATAWEQEIDRRLDDVAAGRATFQSWDEARKQIVGNLDVPQA